MRERRERERERERGGGRGGRGDTVHVHYYHRVSVFTLFPCRVNLICVIPGPAPAALRTETGFGVPNSNILMDPSAPPVRSVGKKERMRNNESCC